MSNSIIPNLVYGFSNPLTNASSPPIALNISPTVGNKAPIGQLWVNKSINTAFILTSIVNGLANWQPFSGSSDFSSLTVDPGPVTLTCTGTNQINMNAIEINLNPVSAANTVNIGNITGLTNIIGDLSIQQGLVDINTSANLDTNIGNNGVLGLFGSQINQSAPTISINVNPSSGTTVIGNTTGGIQLAGTVQLGGGSFEVVTPTDGFILPGPVHIISGAGAPASGLALNVGDLYINTTATTPTTRLFIATGAGSWTAFTALA